MSGSLSPANDQHWTRGYKTYHSLDVLLATEDELGHIFDLEGRIGALASQVCGTRGLIIVDSMALEARLDREMALNSSKACRGGGRRRLHGNTGLV